MEAHDGFCAKTAESAGDCALGGDDSGSWHLGKSDTASWASTEARCRALCARCEQCRFISYSRRHRDCSWFVSCNVHHLQHSVGGFRTSATIRAEQPPPPLSAKRLSKRQRLETREWAAGLDPHGAFVLQIGANDHTDRYTNPDPAPWLVQRGWRALLVEPMPTVFSRLRARYAGNPRVQTVNAVVAPGCAGGSVAFWGLDYSNRSGLWASDDANPRCAEDASVSYLQEISSLSPSYMLRMHMPALHETPQLCERCAAKLGRSLPSHCIRHFLWRALVNVSVPCLSLQGELSKIAPQSLTLLMIDAEGHDHDVLREYPFARYPPSRVIFEASNMGRDDFESSAMLLRRHGMRHVSGGHGTPMSVWHRLDANAA